MSVDCEVPGSLSGVHSCVDPAGEDSLQGLQFGHLSHLVGSVLNRVDQVRFRLADAAMVVVLADSATIDPVAEGALAACARCLDVCFTP